MKKFFAIILAALILITALPITVSAAAKPELTVSVDPSELIEGGNVNILVEIYNSSGSDITEGLLIIDGEAVQEYDVISAGTYEDYSGVYSISASSLGKNIPVTFSYSGGTVKTTFSIGKKEPTINVGTTVRINSNSIVKGDEAIFTFAIENKGNATMKNINLTANPLNNGKVLTSTFNLAQGEATVVTYSEKLEENTKVTPQITFTVGGREYTKTMNEVSVKVTNPEMTVKISVDDTQVNADEEFNVEIYIENSGNANFKSIALYDMDDNRIPVENSTLAAGDYISANCTMSLKESKEIGFYIKATDENAKSYTFNSNILKMYVDEAKPDDFAEFIKFTAEAGEPDENGYPTFSISIENTADISFSNILISEDQMGDINTFATIKAGEIKKFDFSYKEEITELTTFIFKLTAQDPDGNEITVESEPIEIDSNGKKSNSIGAWLWILIIIIVLIIGVGVTLLVIMLNEKNKNNNVKAAQKRNAAVQGLKTASESSDAYIDTARTPAAQPRAKIRTAPPQQPQDLNSFGEDDNTDEESPIIQQEKSKAPVRRVIKRRDFDDRNNF